MLKRNNVLNSGKKRVTVVLLTGILTAGVFNSPLPAQSTAAPWPPKPGGATRQYHPDPFAGRAGKYYSLVWGVDALTVKAVEAGELIRFSYEVLDPSKATSLNDKKLEPKLIAPDAKAVLVIPSLEKVGQLRQSSTPEAGKSY